MTLDQLLDALDPVLELHTNKIYECTWVALTIWQMCSGEPFDSTRLFSRLKEDNNIPDEAWRLHDLQRSRYSTRGCRSLVEPSPAREEFCRGLLARGHVDLAVHFSHPREP